MKTEAVREGFLPFPALTNPHAQTLVASLLPPRREPPSRQLVVALPDGDRLSLEVSTPPSWRGDGLEVVLVHGLTGSHRSPYMVRLADKLYRRGVRAVRLNLRGCGSGAGLARKPYHAGLSDDLEAALRVLRARHPRARRTLIGFSMGANLVLRLAGLLGDDLRALVRQIVVVAPPADLESTYQRLAAPQAAFYHRVFLRELVSTAKALGRAFPESAPPPLPPLRELTIKRFDGLYTAPQWRFRDADDYYAQASSAPYLERIAVPANVLLAEDDPLIDFEPVLRPGLPLTVLAARRGGHLGFLGCPWAKGGARFMDSVLLEWLGLAPQNSSS